MTCLRVAPRADAPPPPRGAAECLGVRVRPGPARGSCFPQPDHWPARPRAARSAAAGPGCCRVVARRPPAFEPARPDPEPGPKCTRAPTRSQSGALPPAMHDAAQSAPHSCAADGRSAEAPVRCARRQRRLRAARAAATVTSARRHRSRLPAQWLGRSRLPRVGSAAAVCQCCGPAGGAGAGWRRGRGRGSGAGTTAGPPGRPLYFAGQGQGVDGPLASSVAAVSLTTGWGAGLCGASVGAALGFGPLGGGPSLCRPVGGVPMASSSSTTAATVLLWRRLLVRVGAATAAAAAWQDREVPAPRAAALPPVRRRRATPALGYGRQLKFEMPLF